MSEKNLDKHGRLCSKTVARHTSPEEANLLDRLVAISSMTKQDYIISKLSDTTVKIVPSSRMRKGMEEAMLLVYRELLRITDADSISPELAALTKKSAASSQASQKKRSPRGCRATRTPSSIWKESCDARTFRKDSPGASGRAHR